MSVDEDVYNSPPPTGKARTLASMLHNSKFTVPKKHLGSKNPPILKVEPTQVILDELHLLLRIGDVLLRKVILQADSIDQRQNMHRGGHTENHLRTPQKLPEVLPEEDAIQIGTLWKASSISNIHVHCIPLHVIYHVEFC